MSFLESTESEDEDQVGTERRLSLANVGHKLANWGRRASGTPAGTMHSYTETFSPPLSPLGSPMREQPRPSFAHRGSQSITIALPTSRLHDPNDSDSAASTSEFPEMASFPGLTPIGPKPPTTSAQGFDHSSQAHHAPAATPQIKRLSPRQINKRLSILMMLCESRSLFCADLN